MILGDLFPTFCKMLLHIWMKISEMRCQNTLFNCKCELFMILDIQSVEVLASGNKQLKSLIVVIQRTVERKNIVQLDVEIFFLTVHVLLT